MSPEILAYLAGIIDGEGYIGLVATRQDTYIPRLCVSMTEPHAINLLHSTFGGNVCFPFKPKI